MELLSLVLTLKPLKLPADPAALPRWAAERPSHRPLSMGRQSRAGPPAEQSRSSPEHCQSLGLRLRE